MFKVHVPLSEDEHNILFEMSRHDFRLPEQMIRWLLREEAKRRGLWPTVQIADSDKDKP